MTRSANPVFSGMPATIFSVMSALAQKHGAINLGQGFPDIDGPEFIRHAAAQALITGPNQYPPSTGVPDLRRAVAEHNERFYRLQVDPESEVIITSGATEALADCLLSLLCPGDEAVILEPAYDAYAPLVEAAGGIPVYVPLLPPDWHIDRNRLREAFSERTKVLILNSPMNPTGKVFTCSELSIIGELLVEFDAYAVCDEVYEHLTFDGRAHVPLMTLPGMRDRCIRIGSAGKTFSLTGWKIGYITAQRDLAANIARVHQYVTFTSPPALQQGIAAGLRSGDDYFSGLAKTMQHGRDLLSVGLEGVGLKVLPCGGTYFLISDYSSIDAGRGDMEFCQHLTVNAGVAAIPVSAFYHAPGADVPRKLIRFCFCKDPRLLEQAVARLRKAFA